MGLMRFDLGSDDVSALGSRLEQGFVTNYDGAVFHTRMERQGRMLNCIRQKSDSGKLNISWPIPGYGAPVLRTSSLIERDEPYILALELARGQLCELKDQTASWEHAGMLLPEEYAAVFRDAYRDFVAANFQQDDPAEATRLASLALAKTCRAEELIANAYILQRLQVRRQRFSQPPAVMGCELGGITVEEIPHDFGMQFGAAGVGLSWRNVEPVEGTYHWETYDQQVEWALQNKLVLRGGPLLSLDENGLPDWLENWRGDVLNLQSFLSDYVETVITRYTGKIRIWDVVARMNSGGLFKYAEDDLISLTARMIDVARQVDNDSQIFIRVDQPWGDYQSSGRHRFTPWHVVDALLRSGMGLAGINLELAIGYHPHRDDYRRLLRFSRLLDTWGTFGIPLHVTVHCPSRTGTDPKATFPWEVKAEESASADLSQLQVRWIEQFLPMLMAKQPVVAVFWGNLTDSHPHRFPHSGLIDANADPKSSWGQFSHFRDLKAWLESIGKLPG